MYTPPYTLPRYTPSCTPVPTVACRTVNRSLRHRAKASTFRNSTYRQRDLPSLTFRLSVTFCRFPTVSPGCLTVLTVLRERGEKCQTCRLTSRDLRVKSVKTVINSSLFLPVSPINLRKAQNCSGCQKSSELLGMSETARNVRNCSECRKDRLLTGRSAVNGVQ